MKTKEEKLKAVTDDIRAKLPRLMELEKGCLVKYKNEEYEILGIEYGDMDNGYYIDLKLVNECGDLILESLRNVEIIGKEPMLNDVLEWINIVIGETQRVVSIDVYGKMRSAYMMGRGLGAIRTLEMSSKWDLSKPYLHQQSEELINFLYELL